MAQDKGGRAPGMELLEEALSLVMNRKKAGEAVDRMEEAFGSLAAVFRAPQGQLEDVARLEEIPRRYLQLTLELARSYLEDQAGQMLRIYDLRSRADAFRPKFLGKKNEIVCLMLLDGRGHLRYNDVLLEGSVSEVPIYLRKIVRLCIEYQVQQVVLAHNHPSGNPAPSRGDMLATCRVALALESIDAQLVDHLIFTEDDMFSFQESGMLGSILRHNLSLHKETLTVVEEIYKQLPPV